MSVRGRRWLCVVLAGVLPLLAITATTPVVPARAAGLPTITTVAPATGKTAGGALVTVTGTGLAGATKVMFGSKTGTKLAVYSDTQLSVVAPAGSGTVDVTVTGPAGTSTPTAEVRFRYVAAPKVTKVSANTGSTNGGTRVTISGANFADVSKVLFGSTSGTDVTVASENLLTVISPKRPAGRVDLRVVTAYGTSAKTSKDRYTSIAPPKISKISPTAGPVTGGTKVTITGTGFTKLTQVRFSDTPGTKMKVSSSKKLTITSPLHDPGTVDVRVAGAYGTTPASTKARFSYIAPPTITTLSPASGPVTGGTRTTITGRNFTKVTKVLFGTKIGTKLAVANTTSLTVVAPAQTSRTVDAHVVTAYGISPTTDNDHYTYGTPTPPPPAAPTITSIDPITGPTTGGNQITITGSNLTGTSTVTVGGLEASNLVVLSTSKVTVIAPAHTEGLVGVELAAPGGTITKTSSYTYVAPVPAAPTITSVEPATGPTTGGNQITITGTNLTGTTTVTFGGTDATNLTVVNATTVTVTAPAHIAGLVDLSLTAPGGNTIKTSSYTYVAPVLAAPTITSVEPATGPTTGGNQITITGTNLTGTSKVTIGDSESSSLVVLSSAQVAVIAPAHAEGLVDVAVTTLGGSATKSTSYTYIAVTPPPPDAPTITSIDPASGPTTGGTTVVITGTGLAGATDVKIGNQAARGFAVDSDTQVTAVIPAARTAGSVDVSVTTQHGITVVTPASRFEYLSECGNAHADTVSISGTITDDSVWSPDCATTYVLKGSVLVGSGVTLKIVAGTVVEGEPSSSLQVAGTLLLVGSHLAPVVLGTRDDGSNWNGVDVLTGGVVRLSGATIRQAYTGINVAANASAEATDSRFVGGLYGVIFNPQSTGSVTSSEFTNGSTGLFITEGAEVAVQGNRFSQMQTGILLTNPSTVISDCVFDGITGDTILATMAGAALDPANLDHGNTATNSNINGVYLRDPVFADGTKLFGGPGWGLVISNRLHTVNVPTGATASIPSDVVVKFRYTDGYNGELNVSGTLVVAGTLARVTDDVGGQTIDPAVANPSWEQSQFWGINVLAGGAVRLSGAKIRNALHGLDVQGDGSVEATDSHFVGGWYGIIFNPQSTGSVTGSEFTGGGTGLLITDGAEVTVQENSFTALQTGIYLLNPSTVVSDCSFDSITGDTILVAMASAFDPAHLNHNNTATNSTINGIWLKNPLFADGATVTNGPGWGVVISNWGEPVNIPAGATVNIPAGAVVKFRDKDMWPSGSYTGTLNVAGTLEARGTLTKATDDLGGPTITTNASVQFWGVRVLAGGVAHFAGASIRYAATGVNVATGGTIEVTGSEFTSNQYGLTFEPGSTGSVTNDQFDGGGTGLLITDGAEVAVQENSFTALQTGIYLLNPSTVVSDCSFDSITGDTILVAMASAFDPAHLNHNNTATNSTINGVYLRDPVFADGALLFGRAGWGLVISNLEGRQSVNVPAGSRATIPAGAVVKFRNWDRWPSSSYEGSLKVAGNLLTGAGQDGPPILTSITDDSAGGDTNNDGNATSGSGSTWTGIRVGGIAEDQPSSVHLDNIEVRFARTCLNVEGPSDTRIHGDLSTCQIGVASGSHYVDATNVNWGSPSGPSPYGDGPAISGDVSFYPWLGVPEPVLPIQLPVATCKKVLFIGVRGSGEAPEGADASDNLAYTRNEYWGIGIPFHGLGNKVAAVLDGSSPNPTFPAGDSFLQTLADNGLSRDDVEVRALVYEAASTDLLSRIAVNTAKGQLDIGAIDYLNSIESGVRSLTDLISRQYAHCWSQHIVLVGYSQGAMVIHQALNRLADKVNGAIFQIDSVILIADPNQRASSERVKLGSSSSSARGIWQVLKGLDRRDISPLVSGVVAYCNDLDLVCASDPASLVVNAGDPQPWGLMVHSGYEPLELRQLGRIAAYKVLTGLGI